MRWKRLSLVTSKTGTFKRLIGSETYEYTTLEAWATFGIQDCINQRNRRIWALLE